MWLRRYLVRNFDAPLEALKLNGNTFASHDNQISKGCNYHIMYLHRLQMGTECERRPAWPGMQHHNIEISKIHLIALSKKYWCKSRESQNCDFWRYEQLDEKTARYYDSKDDVAICLSITWIIVKIIGDVVWHPFQGSGVCGLKIESCDIYIRKDNRH